MDRDYDYSLVSTGNVRPCRFVKLGTSDDNTGTEADANEDIIGVSGSGSRNAPGTAADDGYIAIAGETIPVFGEGRKCLLELGTGGATRGGYLKSDADGCGVAAATTGATAQFIGAQALQSGSAGEKILVVVKRLPKYYPALA